MMLMEGFRRWWKEHVFPPETPRESRGSKRILVVVPEPALRRLLQVNLERQGYCVLVAEGGMEAQALVEQERPELIVFDCALPDLDLRNFLSPLRTVAALRSVHLVALASRARDGVTFRGWSDSGIDCYLFKPVNPMELIAFV